MMRMPWLSRSVRLTLGLAIAVLVSIYGGMEIWPRAEAYWQMRSLDRAWHDPSRSAAARAKAAEMLAEFGTEAAPYLLAAVQDADGLIRETAYTYLGSLEPVPEEAVRICLTAVKSDGEPRRGPRRPWRWARWPTPPARVSRSIAGRWCWPRWSRPAATPRRSSVATQSGRWSGRRRWRSTSAPGWWTSIARSSWRRPRRCSGSTRRTGVGWCRCSRRWCSRPAPTAPARSCGRWTC